MSFSRDNVNERIWKLTRRTQFRYNQNVERILWEERVLYPEIEAMKANKVIPNIPSGVFEVEIINEGQDSYHSPDASESNDIAPAARQGAEPPTEGA